MSQKLVVFDMDGVIVSTKEIHFNALNQAIIEVVNGLGFFGPNYMISHAEHLSTYDGLPTKTKLQMLVSRKGLKPEWIPQIEEVKKRLTRKMIDATIEFDEEKFLLFDSLKDRGYKIAVASNAIRETVVTVLVNLGLMKLVDYYQSNEDVTHRKPHPEIYWKCMIALGCTPKDTYIVEDSAIGREGAMMSGATLIAVGNPSEVTRQNILTRLEKPMQNHIKWEDRDMNVLIPMAGAGSRFAEKGYTFPKPLIDVRGKPMIQVVTENLGIKARFIYIVQKAHYEKYNLKQLLNLISPGCEIVVTEGLTEGAACTTLLAKDLINNDSRLVIANSDQFIEWNANETMYSITESGLDGCILTFKSTHPKWSFAKVNEDGFVTEVAEKNPISDNATVGVYFYRKGSDFVKYAEQMIRKNLRVNNEFYVAPVFNEAIKDGKKIGIREVEKMYGIGVPEDLDYFLNNYKGVV